VDKSTIGIIIYKCNVEWALAPWQSGQSRRARVQVPPGSKVVIDHCTLRYCILKKKKKVFQIF
jgi:hypothetical protein